MKKSLNTTKALVKSILEKVPETRNSDMLLYFVICDMKNASALELPFGAVITNLDKYNLPPFESVRRSRQILQAAIPELASSPEIETFRTENEKIYENFSRSGA